MNTIHRRRSVVVALLLLCAMLPLGGCGAKAADGPASVTDCAILHEPEFGGVYIEITIDDFNALGYTCGDSVDIAFSNGYTLEDQPYYNGYYTENGQTLLVAYPGYDYIKACVNNGDDLWDIAGLGEDDTATVSLRESGKYLDIQNARDIHYYDERERYDSDEQFANFRGVSVTGIAADTLYRSASPCDNQHSRAAYVNALMEEAGVRRILDLADSDGKIQGYIAAEGFDCPYFLSLYESGGVIPLALNTNFTSEAFTRKLAAGLIAMAEQDGPYLVHCTEGKDRTGFVCMLLEALCGAGYDEIVDDYMITYDNYYRITAASDPDRYNVIVEHVLDPMIRILVPDADTALPDADLAAGAADYLLAAGMDDGQLALLRSRLTASDAG